MLCEKCGSVVQNSTKCYVCGFDNAKVDFSRVEVTSTTGLRSTRVTIFMSLVIVLDVIAAFIQLAALTTQASTGAKVLFGIGLILCVLEIILAFFVLKMKRWALNAYITLSVIGAIGCLIRLDFFTIIFKSLLLYFIFRNDWEYFE